MVFWYKLLRENRLRQVTTSGFTLIEVLVVIIIVGVLASIALPAFTTFSLNQKLSAAQSEIFRAIQDTQSVAKRTQSSYQVSFRAQPGTEALQYVIHGSGAIQPGNQAYWDGLGWRTINSDTDAVATIAMRGVSVAPNVPTTSSLFYAGTGADFPNVSPAVSYPIKFIRFDAKGNTISNLLNRYIALRVTRNPGTRARRCITITTVLGATRLLSEGESSCPNDPAL